MRANVIAYDEEAPLANIISFLTRAPVRSVIITWRGKPTGLVTRAAVVRWFLENRWTNRTVELPTGLATSTVTAAGTIAAATSADPDTTLETMARQLVALAGELHGHLQADPTVVDPAPLVGGASRMQQVLDDLLSSAPAARRPDTACRSRGLFKNRPRRGNARRERGRESISP